MKSIEFWTMLLLIVSGLLWGLVGLFQFDLLAYMQVPDWFYRVLYFFFGVAGVYALIKWKVFKKR